MAAKPNVAAVLRGLAGCWFVAAALLSADARAAGVESLSVQRDGREWVLDPRSQLVHLAAQDRHLRLRLQRPPGPSGLPRRYRIWLQGHDPGWVELTQDGERRYERLAPGSYQLRAASALGGWWDEVPAITVVVQPPWWRTQSALVAAALVLLVLLAWFAAGQRARQRRRRAWQVAQARQQLAEQHSEAKSRFLATLGHEIRTPMTGVLGMAELLQGSELDARQRAQVDAIGNAGRHLLRLLNDALDLARIEAGKLVLEDAPFELRPLLADVAGLLRPLAEAKGQDFALACDDALPVALRGDGTRVRQVLFNLAHNAIKFCERGQVRVQVGLAAGGGLRLEVSDSGPGVSADQQTRLFQRFEPGRGSARDSGSGLGLAICEELAAAMGGTITLRSEPGHGARFVVELPLPAAELPRPAAGSAAGAAPAPGTLRLLLVEDDDVIAEVVRGLLARAGHEVVHAGHGLAALAELECGWFDLALLDLDLPGIDGLGLARLIRARGLAMPLLAITARADAEAEPAARAAGMNGFLRKPVTGPLLLAAVGRLVAGEAGAAIGAAGTGGVRAEAGRPEPAPANFRLARD